MQKYETISLISYDHLENTLEIYIYSYIQKYLCLNSIHCYETGKSNWNVELTWSISIVFLSDLF